MLSQKKKEEEKVEIDLSKKSIIFIIVTLIYIISPIDILPDFIPPFTYIDDLLLLILTGLFIYNDCLPGEPH